MVEHVGVPVAANRNWARTAIITAAVGLWLFFAVGFGLKLMKPIITYDGAVYLGLVAAPDWTDAEAVRQSARIELSKNLSYADTNHFADPPPSLSNPAIFQRDLAFYQMKFGYVEWARIVSLAGLDAFSSLRAVSLFSYILLVLVPLVLIAKHRTWPFLFILPAIWVGSGMREIVLLLTPDLPSAAMGLVVLVGWIYGSVPIAFAATVLAAIIRPEVLIMSFGILLVSLALRSSRKRAAACFAAALCAYLIGRLSFDYAGWWQHVSMSLFGPDEVVFGAPPLTAETFIRGAIGAWLKIFATFWIWGVIALAAAYFTCSPARSKIDRRLDVLFWGTVLGLIGRMITFPMPETRVYFAAVAMLSVLLALRANVETIMRSLTQRLESAVAYARSWLPVR